MCGPLMFHLRVESTDEYGCYELIKSVSLHSFDASNESLLFLAIFSDFGNNKCSNREHGELGHGVGRLVQVVHRRLPLL